MLAHSSARCKLHISRTSALQRVAYARHVKPATCQVPLDPLHLKRAPRSPHSTKATSGQAEPLELSPGDRVKEAVAECVSVVKAGRRKFLPMIMLFFSMAFINTLLDNLKDTLIFTQAVGGGAHVVPWLQVYGVLPCSLLFLTIFNRMAAQFSRRRMFNIIIGFFMGFIAIFSIALFPHVGIIHPTKFCEMLLQSLPSGFAGSVAVVHNWSYSLFYCAAELWGDVCLSLLFWSLANEITSLKDAAVIYPLFGIGANVAQVCAGQVLKAVGASGSAGGYVPQMQALCTLVLALGACILLLHEVICRRLAQASLTAAQGSQEVTQVSAATLIKSRSNPQVNVIKLKVTDANASSPARLVEMQMAPRADDSGTGSSANGSTFKPPAQDSHNNHNSRHDKQQNKKKKKKPMSFSEAIRYCWTNASIRCLAIMGIAQGLASNTLEYAWKLHLSQFCPTSQAFTSFLGDVASYTGVVTVMMMLVAPTCFKLLGWRRTARATPNFLLYAGVPFFIMCITYQVMMRMPNFAHLAQPMLFALAVLGAALYVLTRSAKFSLFKPAEELIYIGLDEKARTSGKAAVDVLGAQLGKSTGALMQQILLVVTAASALHSLPVMGLIFMGVSVSWGSSVDQLSLLVKPHTSLESCNSQESADSEGDMHVGGMDGSNGNGGNSSGLHPAVASA